MVVRANFRLRLYHRGKKVYLGLGRPIDQRNEDQFVEQPGV
jgi:hypothetical protein